MHRWHAPFAWTGGSEFASDVLVTVEKGMIVSVDVDRPSSDADTVMHGILIPGLVSAHSHAFHRVLRGRTHDDGGDFWAWRNPMYAIAAYLDPERYRRLATAVFGEMVLAGITTVGEFHYVHHQADGRHYDDPNAMGIALAEAAADAGIRLTLIDTAYLSSEVGGAPVLAKQRRFDDGSVEAWKDRVHSLGAALAGFDRVQLGVAAHSVRGVPKADIRAVADVASELNAPLHIHASEQPAENAATAAIHGVTPIRLLADEGFLGPRTTLVHATHVTEADIADIASSRSIVCVCPTTEADLGDGIGPSAELAAAGVAMCLGSDSNAVTDILREAWAVEQHDRLRLGRRGIHQPHDLLHMATTVGMRSLGWSDRGLAIGAHADFVIVNPASDEMAGAPRTPAGLMSSATRSSVTDVVVAGRHLVGSPATTPVRSDGSIASLIDDAWETAHGRS